MTGVSEEGVDGHPKCIGVGWSDGGGWMDWEDAGTKFLDVTTGSVSEHP